jgi:hypothetical protein
MLLNQNSSLGRVVKLNAANGAELKRSPLNTINARTIVLTGGKIRAVAGENRGNGAIRLIEINSDTLEMAKQGDDDIAPQSLLWVNGSDLYAISTTGGNLYLARFDTNLALQAKSSVTVHPNAALTFNGDALLTQRTDGSALLLNPRDLTEKR